VRPWSYSRLSCYEDCPKQYWYSYVENVPGFREPSPAAERGTDIHAKAEQYLVGQLKIYPPELQKVSSHAMKLKTIGAKAEVKLGAKEDWSPCGFEDKDAMIRGIIDILYEVPDGVHIQDWKTGQVYGSHASQMEFYTALVAAHYPTATNYFTTLVYIDQGLVTRPRSVDPGRIKPIRMLLKGRIENAEADTIFPVQPGSQCKWCDYSKRYGGPCQY